MMGKWSYSLVMVVILIIALPQMGQTMSFDAALGAGNMAKSEGADRWVDWINSETVGEELSHLSASLGFDLCLRFGLSPSLSAGPYISADMASSGMYETAFGNSVSVSSGFAAVGVNAIYEFPTSGNIALYVGGGLGYGMGWVDVDPHNADSRSFSSNTFALNFLGGVKFPVYGKWMGTVDLYQRVASLGELTDEDGAVLYTSDKQSKVDLDATGIKVRFGVTRPL
jgi:opacity protein-like surface antigen